ncbi:hypothetical protein BKA66DRAFT_577835 [Pyrenochaeta sp. MPI-SDFR-AT-0127]|nr:hypothetical protein BKA66DRAFT_577835 [Pyrenochaeta sp. MPI-SDFR-AT-0127]
MLWYQWLLGAFVSQKAVDQSLPTIANIERVEITHFVLEAPLVMPTITVTKTETVGVIATPVVHNLPTFIQAQPRPTLDAFAYSSLSNHFEASPSPSLDIQLAWIQWLLEERFSLLTIVLAVLSTPVPFLAVFFLKQVLIRATHQMLAYHDNQNEARRIDRIAVTSSCFIGKCLFPETFGYGPGEEPLSARRIWMAIWKEILRPLWIEIGRGLIRMCIALEDRLGDGLVRCGLVILEALGWCTDRLPGCLETLFKANGTIRMMVLRGIIGVAFRFYDWLIVSVCFALRESRLGRGFKNYQNKYGYDFDQDRSYAYYIAKTESLDDAARRVLDYNDVKIRHENLLLNFEKATQDAISNLAKKTLSYRTSIIELIKIVNWTRCAIAQSTNYRHNEKLGRYPGGPMAKFPYTASQLKFIPVAQNGVHFSIMESTICRNDIRGANLRCYTDSHFEKKDPGKYMAHIIDTRLVGFFDLFKDDTLALRKNYPGISLPPYEPHEDPINISNRRPKTILKSELRWKEQIEDFAAEGRLLQYGLPEPRRTVTFGPDDFMFFVGLRVPPLITTHSPYLTTPSEISINCPTSTGALSDGPLIGCFACVLHRVGTAFRSYRPYNTVTGARGLKRPIQTRSRETGQVRVLER